MINRTRAKQQFCWIASGTARGFIDQLNTAGDDGWELYSTYQVQDKFMGALMIRHEIPDPNEIPQEPSAVLLKLVRDNDGSSSETKTPADEEGSALPETTDAGRDAD